MKPTTTTILIAAPVLMLVIALANIGTRAIEQAAFDAVQYEVMK